MKDITSRWIHTTVESPLVEASRLSKNHAFILYYWNAHCIPEMGMKHKTLSPVLQKLVVFLAS